MELVEEHCVEGESQNSHEEREFILASLRVDPVTAVVYARGLLEWPQDAGLVMLAVPQSGDAEWKEERPGKEPGEVLEPVGVGGQCVEVGGGAAAEKAEDVLVPEVEPRKPSCCGVAGFLIAARMCQGAAIARKSRSPVMGRRSLTWARACFGDSAVRTR